MALCHVMLLQQSMMLETNLYADQILLNTNLLDTLNFPFLSIRLLNSLQNQTKHQKYPALFQNFYCHSYILYHYLNLFQQKPVQLLTYFRSSIKAFHSLYNKMHGLECPKVVGLINTNQVYFLSF